MDDSKKLAQVMEFAGCSEGVALAALEAAGPSGWETAVSLALEMAGDPAFQPRFSAADVAPPPPRSPTKVVCLVREDLGMGVGKIAAQVSHAVLGALRRATAAGDRLAPVVQEWQVTGETTIVLQVALPPHPTPPHQLNRAQIPPSNPVILQARCLAPHPPPHPTPHPTPHPKHTPAHTHPLLAPLLHLLAPTPRTPAYPPHPRHPGALSRGAATDACAG